jgi:hypothetical protein
MFCNFVSIFLLICFFVIETIPQQIGPKSNEADREQISIDNKMEIKSKN